MINHARTLLLNRGGSATGYLLRPGEEFIDPLFRPVTLPTYITTLRQILFGYRPDWLFENYRARQFMTILHSTELAEFVTRFDARLTYDVQNRDLFREATFGISVNTDADSIRFVGTQPAPDETGQSIRCWRVTVVDEATLRVERLGQQPSSQEYPVTTDGTWSSLVPLGSPDFHVSTHLTPSRTWVVEETVRPSRSLGELLAATERVPDGRISELFGIGTAQGETEPWLTFRNLWQDHRELPYRLGALLLAIIYRTEERRVRA